MVLKPPFGTQARTNVSRIGDAINGKPRQVLSRFSGKGSSRHEPAARAFVQGGVALHLCITVLIQMMSIFALNAASGTPIYRQLIDQTTQLIASGRLAPGDLLPSVRAVAAQLGVNPMTVSKAYSLLERDGVVVRRRGMGMVVSDLKIDVAEAIRLQADALVEAAVRLRMSPESVADAVRLAWQRQEEGS